MTQTPTSFLFVVNELPVNDNPDWGGIPPRVNENGHWIPPMYRAGFGAQIPGHLFRWRQGNITHVYNGDYQWYNGDWWHNSHDRGHNLLTHYRTTSLFWCNDFTQFLMLESDATTQDMETAAPPDNRWYPLTFHNVNGVSRVVVALDDQYLAGNRAWWIARLGLESYRSLERTRPVEVNGLGGRIATILGLVAFSCRDANDLYTILTSRDWCRGLRDHNRTHHGRRHERGVVVNVYLDPDNPVGSTPATLEHLEWHGDPILR
ncbi:N-acetyl-gamma-glutamyl-phosphate reductase protein [Rutstroemia sp. NJR-2017a WRK4]|nr:N-acetyl-gamma-glutamyl-phosphate reductase protein [Rutstroemia sp. NJR-2017a WRK4]